MGSQGVPLEKFVLVIPSTPEQFAAQSPSASVAGSCPCGGLREPDNLALSAAPAALSPETREARGNKTDAISFADVAGSCPCGGRRQGGTLALPAPPRWERR